MVGTKLIMQQKHIINCPCFNASSEEIVENFVLDKIKNQQGGYTVAINALKIVKYNKDTETKQVIDKALIQTPDGFGATFAFKTLFSENVIRIDLPGIVLDLANKNSLRVVFIGASEENNKLAINNINLSYPNINTVGRLNGFFKDISEIDALLSKTSPHIVLIGMGSPKQEIISAKLFKNYSNILFIGCGGRIDVLSGNVKRAPKWIQKYKLEGAYRVLAQPRRIPDLMKVIEYFYLLYKSKYSKIK